MALPKNTLSAIAGITMVVVLIPVMTVCVFLAGGIERVRDYWRQVYLAIADKERN